MHLIRDKLALVESQVISESFVWGLVPNNNKRQFLSFYYSSNVDSC